jgi:hypothetical protein
MSTGSFAGGKVRPGRDADPSPSSSAEVKNRVELIPLLSLRAFVAYERTKITYIYTVQHKNIIR